MQSFTAYDGAVHPVRDDHLIWPAGWSEGEEAHMLTVWREKTAAHHELITPRIIPLPLFERMRLEAIGKAPFTPRHRDLLAAWTNRKNINSALTWLQGVDYRALGFTTACQVHGNRNERPCGCCFDYVIDHHRRSLPPEQQVQIPIRGELCAQHRGFNDLESAFFAPARAAAA